MRANGVKSGALALLLTCVGYGVPGAATATGQLHPRAAIKQAFKHPSPPLSAAAAVDAVQLDAASVPEPLFQVAQPIWVPSNAPGCEMVLMEHAFANSYGAPFVSNYTPPACDFDHVVINFTVLVQGRQYDRTGVMYLGDTEVWRTTTAEPTPIGIRWVWMKDMTPYLSLWKQPQTLIFDLENVVDGTYTGTLATTLTASFYKSTVQTGGHAPADLIIPISERTGSAGEPSMFTYPSQNATNTVSFPRNANRAVFTVSVKGQGNDEFYWSNLPEAAVHTFDDNYGTYPGYSAWREVQVLIDGRLAGVSWPFPTIFTGGVVPALHRPIVGIDAFDMREHEIDITPWLPLLCNGVEHTFTIKVIGLLDDGASSASLSTTTEDSWYLTGKIFVWLDDEKSITTGTSPLALQPKPHIKLSQSITQDASGANETLEYTLDVTRDFSVSSIVKTQRSFGLATWTQTLSYSNQGGVYSYGNDNLNTFAVTGTDTANSLALGSGAPSYSTNYHYPLFCNSTAGYSAEGNLTIWGHLDQGLNLVVHGAAVFPTGLESFEEGKPKTKFTGALLKTNRDATGDYHRYADNSLSWGSGFQGQKFFFGGLKGPRGDLNAKAEQLYYRDVSAVNTTVTDDSEVTAGNP